MTMASTTPQLRWPEARRAVFFTTAMIFCTLVAALLTRLIFGAGAVLDHGRVAEESVKYGANFISSMVAFIITANFGDFAERRRLRRVVVAELSSVQDMLSRVHNVDLGSFVASAPPEIARAAAALSDLRVDVAGSQPALDRLRHELVSTKMRDRAVDSLLIRLTRWCVIADLLQGFAGTEILLELRDCSGVLLGWIGQGNVEKNP